MSRKVFAAKNPRMYEAAAAIPVAGPLPLWIQIEDVKESHIDLKIQSLTWTMMGGRSIISHQ